MEFVENKKTFNRLLNKEFKIIRKIFPDIKIYQTGGDKRKYFKYNTHVKELGNLNRKVYLKYLQEALLVIVPASSGPGTKIKIIEALCYNKYLLTTKFGMKGIKSKFNKKIIYSNLSEFKKKINYLKNHNFQLASQNKVGNFFRAHYNVKNIIRKFHENYL